MVIKPKKPVKGVITFRGKTYTVWHVANSVKEAESWAKYARTHTIYAHQLGRAVVVDLGVSKGGNRQYGVFIAKGRKIS